MQQRRRPGARSLLRTVAAVGLALATLATATPASFVLESASAVVDLSSPVVHVESSLVARAVAAAASQTQAPTDAGLFVLAHDPVAAKAANSSLAFLEARLDDRDGDPLEISLLPSPEKSAASIQYYTVKLPEPLAPGEKVKLFVKSVYVGGLEPVPFQIKQSDEQAYVYRGSAYLLSPYPCESQRTLIRLPDQRDPISYSNYPKPVIRKNGQILYGPYKNVAALSREPIRVHYNSNAAVLHLREFTRSVEISHWAGALTFIEDYELHHRGAKLKDNFSRVQYKLSQWGHGTTSVVKQLTAILPAGATNVYYRDIIGNVSTSHFRNEPTHSVLEIQPRYPMYGGWKYTWFQGYTAGAEPFLRQHTQTGRYYAQLSLKPSINGLTVGLAKLRVVLPEGATDVRVETSNDVDDIAYSITFTYLDSTGRPTVTVTKSNLVDEYECIVQISYTYSTLRLLQKPLVVSAYVFGFFAILIAYFFTDFSIMRDPVRETADRIAALRDEADALDLVNEKALGKLIEVFRAARSTSRSSKMDQDVQAAQKQAHSELDPCYARLSAISAEITALGQPRLGDLIGRLGQALSRRLSIIETHHRQVLAFFADQSSAATASATAQRRKQLTAMVEQYQVDLGDINDEIDAIQADMDQ